MITSEPQCGNPATDRLDTAVRRYCRWHKARRQYQAACDMPDQWALLLLTGKEKAAAAKLLQVVAELPEADPAPADTAGGG
jgi:hypothetical protein